MTDFDQEPLPPRARRRMLTPVGAIAGAVAIAALGFVGGVQVEKGRGSSSSTPAAGFAARFQGGGQTQRGGGGAQRADATIGQVSSVDGRTFYVADQSGNKVRVKTNSNSKVTRSAVANAHAIHPGDTVIVQGRTANSGTVTATTVIATASNATSGFGAFFRGGGAAGGFNGGATPPNGG